MRKIYVFFFILLSSSVVFSQPYYHPYYQTPPPYLKQTRPSIFSWGFNMGIGVLKADKYLFGCSSPAINEGENYFSFDGEIHFSPNVFLIGRLGIIISSSGGHSITGGTALLLFRLNFNRFFLSAGGGSTTFTVHQFPDEEGLELETSFGVIVVGAGIVIVRKINFRMELEANVETPIKESSDSPSYSIGQLTLGFKW